MVVVVVVWVLVVDGVGGYYNGGIVCLLLLYTIATVFQLYYGSDLMYEMRRRKPKPTLLSTQRIFNPPTPHRHGTRGTGL